MSTQEVSRITGYTVRAVPPEDAHNKFWYGAFDENGMLIAKEGNYEPKMALRALLEAVYKIH